MLTSCNLPISKTIEGKTKKINKGLSDKNNNFWMDHLHNCVIINNVYICM